MSLNALQQQFAQDAAKLIQQAKVLGYEVSFGEAWRTPQQAQWDADHGTGIACSLHLQRLAIDLNVFVNGIWQMDDSSGCYKAMGEFWKSLGSDHFWGGDFQRVDLDHFSISPDGVIK
jgi:hypothetical protein